MNPIRQIGQHSGHPDTNARFRRTPRVPPVVPFITPVLIVALVVACAQPPENRLAEEARRERIEELYEDYRKDFPRAPETDVEQLINMKDEGDVVVVDAREPEERAVSFIPGSISKEEFQQNKETYKDRTVVAYCTIGYRSGELVERLQTEGFDAYNLKGSILAWVHAGQPVVNPEGNETRRVHTYGRRWALLPDNYEAVY